MQQPTCVHCGSAINSSKRKDAKYCSPQCMEQGNVRRCDEPGCEKPHRARGLCSTHYNARYLPGSQKIWPASPDVRRKALRRKTQRRRALMKGVTAELVDRDVVGARDRWCCAVCRKRVNNKLSYPHPRSASLDHIMPVSQGGDHTYANSRITHLECNVRRSDGGGGEQLALL